METDGLEYVGQSNNCIDGSQSAVNNLIIDYYKKFGRKRDLEQFFSLSTAQSDIRDPTSLFWRKMKSQSDSSDSGEKKTESSTELCRISIKCSIPEPSTSQDDYTKVKSDSESPPIIREEAVAETSRNSDNESMKSEDMYSHKSVDGTLDTSTNKPHSPTSSITSQRKLEWDSLADVGYANASDRKNSASSLSTLERMALQQQYSNNDTKQNSDLGLPTAQSTPLDDNENKPKNKKSFAKKTTKIYNRDIDSVKLNISHNAEHNRQPINVNLTKHISFNVEKDGGVTIENVTKSVSLSPEKVSVETEVTPQATIDKEIQTTLNKNKQKSSSSSDFKDAPYYAKKNPVLISLNSLKKKTRQKKVMRIKRQQRKKKWATERKIKPLEKSTEQLSEAESFEYMPGHIYNQNQMNELNKNNNMCGNKSSLESSAGLTTDSSKTIKYSFTKDLEISIDILKKALEHRFEDSKLKKKLIKEVVQRLVKTKYKDDDSSTEFLSGLSFDSKKVDLCDITHTTSSTSDANNTANKTKTPKPKKSILRMDKFNANAIASTSQSVPNLPVYSKTEKPIPYTKKVADASNTDSDISSKNKNLSDTGIEKTSSEVLYKKYLDALKREETYKKHLKDKEIFLRQKLVGSDLAFNVLTQAERRKNNLKDLMNDLVRNNYDDGSGDASKLEGGSNSNVNFANNNSLRKQRSHSVFTLSSGNSDNYTKRSSENKKAQNKVDSSKDCYHKSERHYCCCPYHTSQPRVEVIDSSVQVDLKSKFDICPDEKATQSSPQEHELKICQHKCDKCKGQTKTQIVSDCANEDVKYFCFCTGDDVTQKVPENILIYKCSRLTNKCRNLGENLTPKVSNTASEQFSSNSTSPRLKISTFNSEDCESKCLIIKDNISSNNHTSKSSQTNINLPIKLGSKSSEQSFNSSSSRGKNNTNLYKNNRIDNLTTMTDPLNTRKSKYVYEATRCIQTEISIDPKISDPSLSDINIINEKNCVDIISEKYKEVSQPSSNSNIEKQTETKSASSSAESNVLYEIDSSKCVCTDFKEQSTNAIDKFDKEIQSSDDIDSNVPVEVVKQSPKNFTIPIQGTNMTLKVSLGSGNDTNETKKKLQNNVKNNTKFASVGIGTDKNNIVDNYTSLQEECSKGVQSCNANIFDEFYERTKIKTHDNIDKISESIGIDTKENNSSFPKPCSINTCIANCCKYNTFPKKDNKNVQKPLLRSNTDTGKMEKSCHVTFTAISDKQDLKEADIQKSKEPTPQMQSKSISTMEFEDKTQLISSEKDSLKSIETEKSKSSTGIEDTLLKTSNSDTDNDTKSSTSKDPILDIIQDITRRYSKKDIEKTKRKKCFREIITFLNYLLDTDDNTDHERNKASSSSACETQCSAKEKFSPKERYQSSPRKTFADKAVQLSTEKSKPPKTCTDSSDFRVTTETQSTSSDSATCKVLNKIKKECEKYHQTRCKSHARDKKCEASSSTSINCDQCRRVHHCPCKGHKCKNHKAKKSADKKKKCVAYNLIIQTSDSVVSEDVNCDTNRHKLQNIIVKVPSKRKVGNMPFKEVTKKIEKDLPHCSPRSKNYRSRSLPNDSEISSTDEFLRKANAYTVREYLERNRPDFVEKSSNRQHCLKLINETRPECDKPRMNMIVVHNPSCTPSPCTEACTMCYKGVPIKNCNPCLDPYMHYVQNEVTRIGESVECAVLNANERIVKRQLLSLQLERAQALSGLNETELRNFATVLGHELRRKKVAPKFISEREMKKHSEKIYKSLPEVVHKKEEIKKENIKKTNLLMANIFKKNLQKKTLQGAVNLSNYSTVIKI